MAIYNLFTHPVVLADDRDPDVSWKHHEQRGSAGGVDLAYPLNTPFAAGGVGRWTFTKNQGNAGNVGRLTLPSGDVLVYMHLNSTIVKSGTMVTDPKTLVARSGNTGGVGPHLHVHLERDGKRLNPFNYYIEETEEETMVFFVRRGTGNWWLYDGIKWTELTATPAQIVKKALGKSSEALSDAEFDALVKRFPDKKLGGETTLTAANITAIATAVAKKFPKVPTVAEIVTGVAAWFKR